MEDLMATEKLKILVTGGAGFIGSNLVEHLLKQGHSVSILDDFSSGSVHAIRACYNFPEFYCMKGSVTNYSLVEQMMMGMDAVFHLAAQVHVEESIFDPRSSFDVNSTGTLNILEASRRTRPRFILYASSTEVYGNAQYTPMKEDHPLAPQSPYAAGKAAADRLCFAYHATYKTPVVVLRQFNTYGAHQRFKGYSAVIPIFAARIFKGRPPVIFGNGEQSRDFHYVDDLMRAYDLMMGGYQRLVGRAINFGTGIETSINTLARTMIEVAATEWKRPELAKIEPVHVAPRPGEVGKFAADISAARSELGFEPNVDLKTGLRSYLRWFMEEHQDEG
jgi:UDP-glucose 4-epimerase